MSAHEGSLWERHEALLDEYVTEYEYAVKPDPALRKRLLGKISAIENLDLPKAI